MNHIFICACKNAHKISTEKVNDLEENFRERNINYTTIDDLCGTVVDNPNLLNEFKKYEKSVLIGCHPKSMKWLLHRADIKECCTNIEFFHIEETSVESLLEKNVFDGEQNHIESKNVEWKPWYPVIDYSKCSNCQQCANFCLFGVYKLDEYGILRVENPANCKDQCPACARVCPEQAITFPKHNESPIDGGEGNMKVFNNDEILNQIQEQDIYNVLTERRNKIETSLFANNQFEVAKEERECCSSKPVTNNSSENKSCC
jgi:Pyruvate/2-oxoacid:ferredoxin oxidoreductase delta subunit